jgi:transcriptional regulator with XRE-family HTH domain
MPKNHIKDLRQGRGWSQSKLAYSVGTSTQQISYLELGRRRLTDVWIFRLSRALECHPADLLDIEARQLTPREHALLSIFRKLGEEQKTVFLKAASALAHSLEVSTPRRRKNR